MNDYYKKEKCKECGHEHVVCSHQSIHAYKDGVICDFCGFDFGKKAVEEFIEECKKKKIFWDDERSNVKDYYVVDVLEMEEIFKSLYPPKE